LPLVAKVTNVVFKEKTTSALVRGSTLDGAPKHLRVLGQRITVTSPDKAVSFIVGPDVKKAHTYSVEEEGSAPTFTVVGDEGATVALIYKGSCLFKNT